MLLPYSDQIAQELQARPRVGIALMLEQQVEIKISLPMADRVQQIGKMLPQLLFHEGILDCGERFQIDLPQECPWQIFPQESGGDLLSAEGLSEKAVVRVDDIAHRSHFSPQRHNPVPKPVKSTTDAVPVKAPAHPAIR